MSDEAALDAAVEARLQQLISAAPAALDEEDALARGWLDAELLDEDALRHLLLSQLRLGGVPLTELLPFDLLGGPD